MMDKCKLWLKACSRKGFGIEKITKHTYICSKHFVGEAGPTAEHPHPLPAAGTEIEQREAAKPVRVRPSPRDRQPLPPPKRRKNEEVDVPEIDANNDEGEAPPNMFAGYGKCILYLLFFVTHPIKYPIRILEG